MIAFLIMKLVDNPNKHIHIPEYVLMAGCSLQFFPGTIKGRVYSSLFLFTQPLLGVVDELEQGINPARFYGLPDMMVNSASALIGVFTIMGLKNVIAADWAWTSHLKEYKAFIGLGALGFTGMLMMCAYLFRVEASGKFWGVYPEWLLIWNILYLLLAPAIVVYRSVLYKNRQAAEDKKMLSSSRMRERPSYGFTFCSILFYMHSLLIYIAISRREVD